MILYIQFFIGARISLINEPKQDTAFDSHSELNRFVKEDRVTFNIPYFKKITATLFWKRNL